LKQPLQGVVPPLATPLSDRDTLDLQGVDRLVDHVLAGGVHGIFVLGTTGEGPSLSYQVRQQLIERVCERVEGRVPVLVGVSDSSLTEAIRISEFASGSGASAVVAAPPFYFPIGQADLTDFAASLADGSPLPVFLYNMPSHTKVSFSIETLRRLIEHPNIVGLKDSSGQMVYFHEALQLAAEVRPDFSLLVGPEQLLGETILMGGHGGVSGGANMFPHVYVAIYKAAGSGDLARVRDLQTQVMKIATSIYSVGGYGGAIIPAVKGVLSLLGICQPTVAEPLQACTAQELETLRQRVAELGLAESRELRAESQTKT
jgi:4-hydroxy-tetrahydrodipicolinate synthase